MPQRIPAPKRKARGRRSGDPLMVRSEGIRITLRPAEYDDLVAIAEGWDVAVGSAGWAIVATFLAKLRNSRADLAEIGIAIEAARRIRPRLPHELDEVLEVRDDGQALDAGFNPAGVRGSASRPSSSS